MEKLKNCGEWFYIYIYVLYGKSADSIKAISLLFKKIYTCICKCRVSLSIYRLALLYLTTSPHPPRFHSCPAHLDSVHSICYPQSIIQVACSQPSRHHARFFFILLECDRYKFRYNCRCFLVLFSKIRIIYILVIFSGNVIYFLMVTRFT